MFSYIMELTIISLTVCFQRLILVYYLFIYLSSIHTHRFNLSLILLLPCLIMTHFDGNTPVCFSSLIWASYLCWMNGLHSKLYLYIGHIDIIPIFSWTKAFHNHISQYLIRRILKQVYINHFILSIYLFGAILMLNYCHKSKEH